MSTIDQQFIEYIVKSLVGHPDDVVVERIIDEKGVLLSLTVNPEDLGRVIGKRGITAQSLRALLRALGTKNDARYNLKIVNNDEERENYSTSEPYERHDRPASREADDNGSAVADTSDSVESPAEEVMEQPVKNLTDDIVEKSSDYQKKTRAELAELDDLDI